MPQRGGDETNAKTLCRYGFSPLPPSRAPASRRRRPGPGEPASSTRRSPRTAGSTSSTPERLQGVEGSGEMGKSITMIGCGPNGETVVFENETALDLYNFKHNLPAEDRPTRRRRRRACPPPTTLKVADGELKFGLLLQAWYVMDDSAAGLSGTSYLGNPTGVNNFRLRRAEIKLSGKVTPAWGFEVMIDPAKTPELHGRRRRQDPPGPRHHLPRPQGARVHPGPEEDRDHRGRAPLLLRDRLRRARPDHPDHRRPAPGRVCSTRASSARSSAA